MFEQPYTSSPLITRTATVRRICAFIVTGLATFLLLCLVWPLSVKEYRSVTSISIAKSDLIRTKEQLKPLLSFAVREEMRDGRIESVIQDTESRAELTKDELAARNYADICDSLQVGVNDAGDEFKLRIAYDGKGGFDERALLDVLADRVAFRMSTGRATGLGEQEVNLVEQMPRAEEKGSTSAGVARVEWLIGQVETDLARLSDSLDQYITPLEPEGDLATSGERDRTFQFASNRKIVRPELDETALIDLRQTIESIDTQSLRSEIDRIRTTGVKPSDSAINVMGIQESKSYPIDGIPDFGSCLLLLSLAGLFGSIVAWHYDPFEQRGFENAHSVSRQLKVPVLALIDSESEKVETDHGWANTTTKVCSLFLLGLTMVVCGFLLVNTEIREAFFTNPFYGCAKIFSVFKG